MGLVFSQRKLWAGRMLSSLSVSPSFRLSIAGLMSALIFQPMLRAEEVSPAAPPSAATASPTPAVPAPAGDPVETSVVKIFSTVRAPDLARPWTKQSPHEISGTGIVIEGKRILTNAHVVLYASQVQVQANQSGQKIFAKVVALIDW